ncbi:hypothetical protein ACEN8K_37090, partial [Variovorax sp. CT11-76]
MLLHSLTRRERGLAFFLGLLLLIGIVGPALPAAEVAIALVFADTRSWHGLPNAMDVLSNLPFVLMGCWGLYWLNRIDRAHHEALAGFPLAPPASDPPDNTLDCAWLFFAGLIGVAVCERVSQRAGWPAAWFVLTTGLLSAEIAQETGNVLPWALVQFGGMALVLTLALSRPMPGAVGLRLGWVIAAYVLAKAFELADQPIYEATHGVISGHTLKHLCAALAALPVLAALKRLDSGWRVEHLRQVGELDRAEQGGVQA